MRFVILAIYFRLKTTVFKGTNLKTLLCFDYILDTLTFDHVDQHI